MSELCRNPEPTQDSLNGALGQQVDRHFLLGADSKPVELFKGNSKELFSLYITNSIWCHFQAAHEASFVMTGVKFHIHPRAFRLSW